MDADALSTLTRTYIAAWSTEDAGERQQLIAEVYAEQADFFADEPGDDAVHRHGRAEILANITEVNQRLTQGHGLRTESTGAAVNHDVVRVSWRMLTPDGGVAMTGMNVLTVDGSGMIVRDHIFIG